jgi:nucleotide-binding universal stress UspA family protein
MKAILIPVEDHALMESVLETALLLARRFGSYMEGVALGPEIGEMVAADFSLSGVIFDDRTRREFLQHDHEKFDSFMRTHVGTTDATAGVPTYGWMGDTLVSDNGVGEYGRLFDVVVVGKPGSGGHEPRRSTLEAALFDSGRPILIAPPTPPSSLGEVIAIAWNGSSETARSIAFAMPLLAQARDVVVLNVPGTRLPGPSAEQITRSLRRHDLPARLVPTPDSAKSPGTLLLDKARELGADLLIKGGYTQSRLRQMIFGGVTSQILAEANMPVFMAH